MFDKEKVIKDYQKIRPTYNGFSLQLKELLTSILDNKAVKFQAVESRCKTVESLEVKLQRKQNKYTDPINEITDFCGIRIILFYVDDIEKAEKLIKAEFLIDAQNSINKTLALKENEFGYQSLHYVVNIDERRAQLSEWSKYKNLKAEIQIRTVLQHSWASISHELEYKNDSSVPSVLRRKLFRLASLIELADEEYKDIRDKYKEVEISIQKRSKFGNIKVYEEINALTIKNFTRSAPYQRIVKNGYAAGFTPETKETEDKNGREIADYELIALECKKAGINSIGHLKQDAENFSKFSKDYFSFLIDTGVKWACDDSFFLQLMIILLYDSNVDDLVERGWHKDIAVNLIKANKKFEKEHLR